MASYPQANTGFNAGESDRRNGDMPIFDRPKLQLPQEEEVQPLQAVARKPGEKRIPISPQTYRILGEPLSETIIKNRGPY